MNIEIDTMEVVEGKPGHYMVMVDGVWQTVAIRPDDDPKVAVPATIEDANANHPPTYVEKRLAAYPPIREQLDMMFKDFAGWKAKIDAIKKRYPKL